MLIREYVKENYKSLDGALTHNGKDFLDKDGNVYLSLPDDLLSNFFKDDFPEEGIVKIGWEDQFREFLEKNGQVIVGRNVIVYRKEFRLADYISIITRRQHENSRGLVVNNYYFYNVVNYNHGVSKRVKRRWPTYGNCEKPFSYLSNSSYNYESMRMAYSGFLGELGNTVTGKYIVNIGEGELDLIVPCYPIDAWVEGEKEPQLYARYPNYTTGSIYNSKAGSTEKNYIL